MTKWLNTDLKKYFKLFIYLFNYVKMYLNLRFKVLSFVSSTCFVYSIAAGCGRVTHYSNIHQIYCGNMHTLYIK